MKKKTFKQYIVEALEDIKEYYGKFKKSREEILELETPNETNFERDCRVGEVFFSSKNGLGQVPSNANILYEGFVVMMKPKDFFEFSHSSDGREASAKEIEVLIREGYPIGPPFLEIVLDKLEDDPKGYAYIVGHEGRARCMAIAAIAKSGDLGLTPESEIPVHFLLRHGMRARHVTDEMIHSMLEDGIIPEPENRKDQKFAKRSKIIRKICINGKEIGL